MGEDKEALRIQGLLSTLLTGRVLRKEDNPMVKFLVNVFAAVVAAVLAALIIRWLNV
jgi:hypothetical protein